MSRVFIVGGVSGSGKTTISILLAKKFKLPFHDADDFHPASNVAKMHAGIALDDEDREPWLEILANKIAQWQTEGGAVLACSALKEKYRKQLASKVKEEPIWVFLEGSPELIAERIKSRPEHFFKASLLKSQFDTYEEPDYGLKLDVKFTPAEIVDQVAKAVQ
ncbi:MAG: gluconokinase [Leeuwenhoekiella sp.]